MDDLLSEFLTETNENLSVLDVELVHLEQRPDDINLLSNIFRLVHTIKGTCGFLGLPRLEAVAHASENVLGKFRDRELDVTPSAVTLILESLDRIKFIMGALEETEAEPPGDDADLIERLEQAAEGKLADAPTAAAPLVEVEAGPEAGEVGEAGAYAGAEFDAEAEMAAAMAAEAGMDEGEAAEGDTGLDDMAAAMAEEETGDDDMAAAMDADVEVDEPPAAAAPDPAPAAPPPAAAKPAAANKANGAGAPEEVKLQAAVEAAQEAKESAIANQSIRVNVDLLENLMTTVSELVLTRNQLLQILRSQKDSEFAAPLQRLNHVVSELQEGVMKTRMQPIGNAWAKLPRIIRDLSQELGKKIDLQMLGADTELDRQVLELIRDPLTHMVRNSADHGIETPAERLASGKAETGRVVLNAYHEGGHIIIEVRDDGKGLNIERIREKIVRQGLASEADAATMTDQQIQQFIFKPGFSTAAQVTSVSGRGVGMDVVRTNIERIGGTVELQSQEGKGSSFTIKIPLTLAIVSALIVESGGERFAIPQLSVVELVRATADGDTRIERVKSTPVLRLRNRLLPLVSLQTLLGLDERERIDMSESFIVVTQVGTYTFGIIVDRVFDTEEIVVKPVSPILRHIEMFSGNTILGDGTVIMILDPNGIAASTGELSLADHQDALDIAAKKAIAQGHRTALLLFKAGYGAPKAVPLALVARLEDFDVGAIEHSNQQLVIQYRGRLMPLVPFDPAFSADEGARQPVLVFSDHDRSMGLMVDEIVDIVEEELSVQLSADVPGVMGSAIVAGKSTDIIDVGYYLTQAYSDWFNSSTREAYEETRIRRLLLVDDSPFFRNLLTPVLTVAGYEVTTVENAADALSACETSDPFDVIVSDIEMPGMSGFDLARTLRNDSRFQNTPLVALSSHASPHDLDRGREAGFTDYVAKFDRDALLASLAQTLSDTDADFR